jgi:hypothetical protein
LKSKKNKNYKFVIGFTILLFCAFAVGGAFLGTYYYFVSETNQSFEENMEELIAEINETNEMVSEFNQGNTIDEDLTRKELPELINKLVQARGKLQKLSVSEGHRLAHANLLKALEANIDFYKHLLSMLDSSRFEEISDDYNSMNKNETELRKYYSDFSIRDLTISIPDATNTFINNSKNYGRELIRLSQDSDIIQDQSREFLLKLDDVSRRFLSFKTDYSEELQDIRSGSGSYDELLTLIDNQSGDYMDLKRDFLSITIPSTDNNSAKAVHDAFNAMLIEHENFIVQLRYSITEEKLRSTNGPLSTDDIKTLYSEANKLFVSVNEKHNNFIRTLVEFRK